MARAVDQLDLCLVGGRGRAALPAEPAELLQMALDGLQALWCLRHPRHLLAWIVLQAGRIAEIQAC
jgi:hypothetical protein